MDELFDKLVLIIVTAIASSGFWAFIQSRLAGKDATTKLLIGLAHNSITTAAMAYIDRGYVTQQEYENLRTYLYDPYCELMKKADPGMKRLMDAVDHLPIVANDYHEEEH